MSSCATIDTDLLTGDSIIDGMEIRFPLKNIPTSFIPTPPQQRKGEESYGVQLLSTLPDLVVSPEELLSSSLSPGELGSVLHEGEWGVAQPPPELPSSSRCPVTRHPVTRQA